MKRTASIRFFAHNIKVSLNNRAILKEFIEKIFRDHGKRLKALNYVFCSDAYLLEMNKEYLSHNFFTDIITFDLSENKNEITGEVYISIDRVRDNAFNEGCWLKEELHRVIFHGALHLCGINDKTTAEQKQMRKNEDLYLALYFG
jgi:rRNA maturation RNase YbeY